MPPEQPQQQPALRSEPDPAENAEQKTSELPPAFEETTKNIAAADRLKVYDSSGAFIFEGTPAQLQTFWHNGDYGAVENIGGVTDVAGRSLVRFGPGNEHGFTDRKHATELFARLAEQQSIQAVKAADQEALAAVRQDIEQGPAPETAALTPQDILRQLAQYSEAHMQAPLEAVADGTFAGLGTLHIENGNVMLIRHATDERHLTKNGRPATAEELRLSSEFSGGHDTGAIHTTADISNTQGYTRYGLYGTFAIPVNDFLMLAKEGKIILGNLGEQEIVLSGDVAQRYLTKITSKN